LDGRPDIPVAREGFDPDPSRYPLGGLLLRDIIDILERWTAAGETVALATVIERIGSAPRDPGATLALLASGELAGNVTGGCVEPAVIREAGEVLAGEPGRVVHYGLDDGDELGVGLRCGGRIAVAIFALDPAIVAPLAAAVRGDVPVAIAINLDERRFGEQTLVPPALDADDPVAEAADALLALGETALVETREGDKLFVESFPVRPNLYLFGTSDHVAALVPIGRQLGYRVSVCDPRRAFVTRERFPDADELSTEWPDAFLARSPIDSRTAICMMTHDVKFEVAALRLALASDAGFIGAMGSEKTRAERNSRLREVGVGEADLARLHAPIGIQIGARTPPEVAVSIAAQLIELNVLERARRAAGIARATVLS
jgi:xanthine dehydrogenase accessory factor